MDTSEIVTKVVTINSRGSRPTNLIVFTNRLFFVAFDFTELYLNLYSLDTENALKVVQKNFTSTPQFVIFGNSLYFTSFDADYIGYEIYGIGNQSLDTVNLVNYFFIFYFL